MLKALLIAALLSQTPMSGPFGDITRTKAGGPGMAPSSWTAVTFTADDTTPDVSRGNIFIAPQNTAPITITDLDDPLENAVIWICGAAATDPATISNVAPFALEGPIVLYSDVCIELYVQHSTPAHDFVEISRNNMGPRYLADDLGFFFGSSSDAMCLYDTTQTPDSLACGVSVDSNAIIIAEQADLVAGTDFGVPLQTNPTVVLQAASGTPAQGSLLDYDSWESRPQTTEAAANAVSIHAGNAWPQAAVAGDRTGGPLYLSGGIGRRLITVTAFGSSAGDTIQIIGNYRSIATTLTEGINFTCVGTSNDICATNLSASIDGLSLVSAYAIGNVVYVTGDPTVYDLTIVKGSGAAGDFATVTMSDNGAVIVPLSYINGEFIIQESKSWDIDAATPIFRVNGFGSFLYGDLTLNGATGLSSGRIIAGVRTIRPFQADLSSGDGLTLDTYTGHELTAAAGSQSFLAVNPKILQTGTAGYYAHRINVTESSTGSGSKIPFAVAVGGVDKFTVSNTGATISTGSLKMGEVGALVPTEPVACSATTTGTFIYVDDTNDSGRATVCLCIATNDDGAGAPNAWDWVRMDDTTAVCPFF